MKRYFLTAAIGLLTVLILNAQDQKVWMFGPMIHFNFGSEKMHVSYGVELSYWNYDRFPYSFDGAVEFEKQKVRVYTEAQTGIGFVGLSVGPVMEYRKTENKIALGAQCSAWGNYFGGIDLRLRVLEEGIVFSPGLYLKLPVGEGIWNGEYHGEHHHWDDWD